MKSGGNGVDIVEKIFQLFIHRTDSYYQELPDGRWTHVKQPLTRDVVAVHFDGGKTVGPCVIRKEDNTAKTLSFDIDPRKVENPKETALVIYKFCAETWGPEHVLLIATRHPDESYHVHVPFMEPVPAEVLRWLGLKALEKLRITNVEVFPKQDRLEGGFGNTIRLPLGLHQEAKKWSKILDPETFKPLPNEAILNVYPAVLTQQQIAQVRNWIKESEQKRINQYARTVASTASTAKGLDLSGVPCVRAFHDNPIKPSLRHNVPAKNFAILYWQAHGSWEGFDEWALWLAENQPEFKAKDITGWKSWVEQAPRKMNCEEMINFFKNYIADFSCGGCPLKATHATTEEPVSIPHLNMVEDPGLAGKPLTAEAVVSSTSIAYLVPKEIEVRIQRGEGDFTELNETLNVDDPINIKLVGVNEDVKYRRLKRLFGEAKNVKVKEKAWRTIYLVRVRPPVFTLEKRGESIVDEGGFEYKAFDVYVIADQPLTFQASALIRLKAKPLGSPKTQKTVLLATRVEFPEETWRFDEVKLRRLRDRLASMASVKERVNWILSEFEKFSGLVGRRNLAFAGFLAFFSPVWVMLDGEIQRGWAVVLFMGDTTTGKSETLRKLIMLLKAGMLVTAETSSQVGLTGTATQLEREGWFVDWGFLVLCDRKLLAIDGVHKLPLSCWAALAEAERSGVVTIVKAAKDTAYARTRQIKIANPVDREAEKWTTKPLADFLYPCQSLPTVLDKTGIARLDLAVFADSRDVKAEEVNIRMNERPDPDLSLLAEALKWSWSGTAKIEFTDEAIDQILASATELYNTFYTQSIPLVSMDLKWKLARLSASLAYLTLSTEDFKTVTVTKDHVDAIVDFIKDEYGKAGLATLAQQTMFEVLDQDDVEEMLSRIKEATGLEEEAIKQILTYIVVHGRFTKDELKTKFSLSDKNELRPLLASLKSEGLIKVGRGFYSEPKLIQAYRVMEQTTSPPDVVQHSLCERCGKELGKLRLIPDKGERWLCDKCEREEMEEG